MKKAGDKLYNSLRKELSLIEKREEKLALSAMASNTSDLKNKVQKMVPQKVYAGVHTAFCKAFALVFNQGRSVIEKSYDKQGLLDDYSIHDYAVGVKGSRRQLRNVLKVSKRSELLNMTLTTLEGIGLGALGVGLPDIVLFISTLLKGVYETALSFGFDYSENYEQYFILKLLSVPMLSADEWAYANSEVDSLLQQEGTGLTDTQFQEQLQNTASIYAMDMLVLKFVQGIPVLGLFAGAANPIYYKKVMKYVRTKYQKRYYLKKLDEISE